MKHPIFCTNCQQQLATNHVDQNIRLCDWCFLAREDAFKGIIEELQQAEPDTLISAVIITKEVARV